MASIGRGRGRGRGWHSKCVNSEGAAGISAQRPGGTPSAQVLQPSVQNIPKHEQKPPALKKSDQQLYLPNRVVPPTSQQESNNPISKQSSATAEITAILQKIKNMRKSEIISQIPSQIAEICKKNESEANSIMSEFSKSLCAKALKDPEFATLGAQLCNALWIMENTCKYLRSPLLSTIQDQYNKKEELKEEQFYGLTVFLCELYNVLRVQGKPLKPLNKPVCDLLKQLISSQEPTDDDAFYFFQEMERVGEVIEQDSKDNMEDIMNKTRELCISCDTIVPSSRCRLVQLIELRAARWRLPEDTRVLYDDLNQDLMAKGL